MFPSAFVKPFKTVIYLLLSFNLIMVRSKSLLFSEAEATLHQPSQEPIDKQKCLLRAD